MSRIVQTALRPAASLLRQVTLSIAATLIASAVLSSIGPGWTFLRPARTETPALTSGGKFAARVESLAAAAADDGNPLPTLVLPPPLLVAESGWGSQPAATIHAVAAAQPVLVSVPAVSATVPRHVLRPDPRRRTGVDAAAVVPPRRADFLAEATPPAMPIKAERSDLAGLWSTSKAMLGQATSFGVTLLDKVTPASLLP